MWDIKSEDEEDRRETVFLVNFFFVKFLLAIPLLKLKKKNIYIFIKKIPSSLLTYLAQRSKNFGDLRSQVLYYIYIYVNLQLLSKYLVFFNTPEESLTPRHVVRFSAVAFVIFFFSLSIEKSRNPNDGVKSVFNWIPLYRRNNTRYNRFAVRYILLGNGRDKYDPAPALGSARAIHYFRLKFNLPEQHMCRGVQRFYTAVVVV